MADLFEKLGVDYVNRTFNGCIFQYNGDVCRFVALSNNSIVECEVLHNKRWNGYRNVPREFFTSFDVFRTPKLGYRNSGLTVVHWETRRSTARGFRSDTTVGSMVDEGILGQNRINLSSEAISEILAPNYIPYATGVAKLLRGERFAFAMNADAAVTLNTEGTPPLLLLFKGQRAGYISEQGVLTLTNKMLKRSHIYSKLEGELA